MNIDKIKENIKQICEKYGYDTPEIVIDDNLHAYGKCNPQTKIITLKESFCDRNSDKVVTDLLKHEIVHLRYPRHNYIFEEECRRMGISKHTRFDHSIIHTLNSIQFWNCSICEKRSICNNAEDGCSINLNTLFLNDINMR